MIENGGILKCEVPGCGFDFKARHGKLGEGFAHVHHRTPLADAPADRRKVALKELAVVCANCHAMIHVGGQCRPLEGLFLRRYPCRVRSPNFSSGVDHGSWINLSIGTIIRRKSHWQSRILRNDLH